MSNVLDQIADVDLEKPLENSPNCSGLYIVSHKGDTKIDTLSRLRKRDCPRCARSRPLGWIKDISTEEWPYEEPNNVGGWWIKYHEAGAYVGEIWVRGDLVR